MRSVTALPALLTPISSPTALTRGPPESPGRMSASTSMRPFNWFRDSVGHVAGVDGDTEVGDDAGSRDGYSAAFRISDCGDGVPASGFC